MCVGGLKLLYNSFSLNSCIVPNIKQVLFFFFFSWLFQSTGVITTATEEKLFCVVNFPNIVDFLIRYKLPSDTNLFFYSNLTPAVLTKQSLPLLLFVLRHALGSNYQGSTLGLVGVSVQQGLQEWAVRQLQVFQQESA